MQSYILLKSILNNCSLFVFVVVVFFLFFIQDSSSEFGIVCELIDEAIVSLCFDIHRSIKHGAYSVLEQSDEKM